MSVIQWCGVALLATVLLVILRGVRAEFVPLLSIGSSILLFGAAIAVLAPFFTFAGELAAQSALGEQGTLLLKMFGIGALVELSCDLCRDMGEVAVANQLEFLGRAELLLLALPSLRQLLSVCASLL